MSGLSQTGNSVLAAAVKDKLGLTAEALNRCFDTTVELQTAEMQDYSSSPPGMDLLQPGVIISLWVDDEVILCAIPEALPLPAWYTQPDSSQQSRLDALAMEWVATCLPDDLPGDTFSADVVPSLWEAISACEISDNAAWLPINVASSDGTVNAQIWILWPATTSPRESMPAWPGEPVASVSTGIEPGFAAPSGTATAYAAPPPPTREATEANTKLESRRKVLLSIPVSVIVKLAEKKIELGQLMVMGPGTIVTFEKSCEDLLDLYVNNQLYCRGEAVKIGEKFGIKVNEVGSMEERVSAVLGWAS